MLKELLLNLENNANISHEVEKTKDNLVRVTLNDRLTGIMIGTCVNSTMEQALFKLIEKCLVDVKRTKIGNVGSSYKLSEL